LCTFAELPSHIGQSIFPRTQDSILSDQNAVIAPKNPIKDRGLSAANTGGLPNEAEKSVSGCGDRLKVSGLLFRHKKAGSPP
jgi:hypothetical protein